MDGEVRHDRASGVGSALRAQRIKHNMPLAEVARALRIRQSFLAAIEDGRFSDLPGPAYAMGFVRTYSEFLGLDGDEVVRRVREEEDRPPRSAELCFPAPSEDTGSPRSGVILVGVFIAAIAYGGWYLISANEDLVSDLASPIPERLTSLLAGTSSDSPEDQTASVSTQQSGTPSIADEQRTAAIPNRPSLARQVPSISGDSEDKATAALAPLKPAAEADAPSAAGSSKQRSVVPSRVTEPDSVAPAFAASREPSKTVEPDDSEVASMTSADAATRAGGRLVGDAAGASGASTTSGSDVVASLDSDASSTSTELTGSTGSAAANGAPDLVIRATEPSWIEIRDQRGNRLTSRLLQVGETYDVPDQSGLRMTVGNAGGVMLVVDGRQLPALGESGVVRRGVSLDPADLR